MSMTAESATPSTLRLSYLLRVAREEDVPWIVPELRQFSNYMALHCSLFGDEQEIAMGLKRVIERGVSFVVFKGEDPAGFFISTLQPHPYNSRLMVLMELFWWVKPKYRGGRAGLLLLDSFLQYGASHADLTQISLEAGSPVKAEALLKRGFKFHEKTYIREEV